MMEYEFKALIILFILFGAFSGGLAIYTFYNDQINKDKFLHCLELGQNKDVCKELLNQ